MHASCEMSNNCNNNATFHFGQRGRGGTEGAHCRGEPVSPGTSLFSGNVWLQERIT